MLKLNLQSDKDLILYFMSLSTITLNQFLSFTGSRLLSIDMEDDQAIEDANEDEITGEIADVPHGIAGDEYLDLDLPNDDQDE